MRERFTRPSASSKFDLGETVQGTQAEAMDRVAEVINSGDSYVMVHFSSDPQLPGAEAGTIIGCCTARQCIEAALLLVSAAHEVAELPPMPEGN